MSESLQSKFDALHAERVRSWAPEKLAGNIAQRQLLVERFDRETVVKVGEKVDPFVLQLSTGGAVDLASLTREGPVTLIFFRFAGCPACNIALPHYDQHLRPALDEAGIRIVAVSPHLPEKGLDEIRVRHRLGFDVASDRDNSLARRFGLTFVPYDNPSKPENDATWIGALTGTDSWELPMPAVVVIDAQGVVRFADVSPDWLRRTEASAILAELVQSREDSPGHRIPA